MIVHNILAGINHYSLKTAEQTDTLLRRPSFELKRIVSRGNTTPEGEWLDQDGDEWVLVVSGRATLILVDDETGTIQLNPGDYIRIPARCRHRVEWTDPQCETVWLALHCDAE